jgi:hypothetical protein
VDEKKLSVREQLAVVEREHRFVFGNPDGVKVDDQQGKVLTHVKCQHAGCARATPDYPEQPIHDDTVQPVLCGGCGDVLYCDHKMSEDTRDEVEGTLSEPVTVSERYCKRCGATLEVVRVVHEPVRFEDLNPGVLAALGHSFTPKG